MTAVAEYDPPTLTASRNVQPLVDAAKAVIMAAALRLPVDSAHTPERMQWADRRQALRALAWEDGSVMVPGHVLLALADAVGE